MNRIEIEKEVAIAAVTRKQLQVKGYRSSSGDTWDYLLEFLPATGYYDLVRESLELLQTDKVEKPASIDLATWIDAKHEMIASWQKTLMGGHGRTSSADALVAHVEGYYTDPARPDLVIVKHMKALHKQIGLCDSLFKAPKKSSEKTKAKEFITSKVPLGAYIGQLNLGPTSVDLVRAC